MDRETRVTSGRRAVSGMPIDQHRNQKIRRALISVSDKTGLRELVEGLTTHNVEILSTGGTARAIQSWGFKVQETSEMTGFGELLGGRVKSLHPALHAALLARRDAPTDLDALKEMGLAPVDLLVVNFYPFIDRPPATGITEAIDLIDIGGPALVRAAAKNHDAVTVITSPTDYPNLLGALGAGGTTDLAFRRRCALRAFALTSYYDSQIAAWLQPLADDENPEHFVVGARNGKRLVYGENPHQKAHVFIAGSGSHGLAAAHQHSGKPLGYNNLLDADAAGALAGEFDAGTTAACVIVKHGSPCGVATAATAAEAFTKAWTGDPLSAFGGVIAFNRPLDVQTAALIVEQFVEVVLAPAAAPDAVTALQARSGVRLLTCERSDGDPASLEVRSLCGGLLVQTPDQGVMDPTTFRTITKIRPSSAQQADMQFAMQVAKHARSNAIVIATGGATLGIGAGQTSRVAAVSMAVDNRNQHHRSCRGPVAASDGFFPFPDGVESLAKAGVVAIAQPGGSRNDAKVIAAADRLGLAMVLTDRRCFRH